MLKNMVFHWGSTFRTVSAALIIFSLAACQTNQTGPLTPNQTTNKSSSKEIFAAPEKSAQAPSANIKPLPLVRSRPVKIALLAPFSGANEIAGKEITNGAAMALLDTPDVVAELVSFDTASDILKAATEASASKTDIIVGPLFGHDATAISPILTNSGLMALSFSKDSRIISSNIFLMGQAVELETSRILRHAARSGARTVAIFGRQGPFSAASVKQAQREANFSGQLRVQLAVYDEDEDYTSVARRVRDLTRNEFRQSNRKINAIQLKSQLIEANTPDGILNSMASQYSGREKELLESLAQSYRRMTTTGVPKISAINSVINRYTAAGGLGQSPIDTFLLTVSGAELSTVAPMFQLYDAKAAGVQLVGLSRWKEMDPKRARELHGGKFAAQPSDDIFNNRYKSIFGTPPTELVGIAYDAMKLALEASREGSRPLKSIELRKIGSIRGAHGSVRMSNGGMALRPLEILEVRSRGFQVIEPARIIDPLAIAETSASSK